MATRSLPPQPLVDTQGHALAGWWRYFYDLHNVPLWRGHVHYATQAASLPAMVLVPVDQNQRVLYRLSWSQRVIRAATTSSALTTTVTWTDGAVTQTESGALMNGNTTATQQSGSILLWVDKNTTPTLSTTYASVGATAMQYDLTVTVEQLI
mgnify:CR=1 FL=1